VNIYIYEAFQELKVVPHMFYGRLIHPILEVQNPKQLVFLQIIIK